RCHETVSWRGELCNMATRKVDINTQVLLRLVGPISEYYKCTLDRSLAITDESNHTTRVTQLSERITTTYGSFVAESFVKLFANFIPCVGASWDLTISTF